METEPSEQISIDRRPIWVVVIDRMRRGIGLALIFSVFMLLLGLEGPGDLSPEGYKVLCLFFLCVALWASNLVPLSVTSLLAIAAIPLLGIMEATQAYSFFGNKAIFFILGVFILSAAMIGCGLSVRLSMWILEACGSNPQKLVAGVYFFGAIGSCFMSEHAVAAMMLPLIHEIVSALKLERGKSVLGRALFLAMAWGCIIGGAATVLGGGRVPLAVEILEQSTQGMSTIGLVEYSWLAFPMVVLMVVCSWLVLIRLYPPDVEDVQPARNVLQEKLQAMGRVSFQERGVSVVMAVTLFFWFVYGDELGIANIAIISIALLFIFNLIDWKMVEQYVNWAIILMYGGAICLGQAMAESGAALWLAGNVFDAATQSPGFFLVCTAFLSMLFTTFMSNSAVIAILMPPVLGVCKAYGINPSVAAMAVILPSNFAFILPIATPASALAYSSRYISLQEMVWSGSILVMIGLLSYSFLQFIYWPLIGFYQ
ncbi:MAG: DASS family sodium-coupled anion symporter [Nitrospinota bacterium]|nr:DASS family sodium-coupled anion symporter [Nitrospinota bacterium]